MSVTRSFGSDTTFVGLSNFGYLLQNNLVQRAFLNNLTLLLVIPVVVSLALFLSTVLFEVRRGAQLYQSVIFLPYLLSVVVSSIMFSVVLQKHGALNTMLESMGLGFAASDWLGNGKIAIFTVMAVMVWREVGFGTLLFLAQLNSLSAEVFEAARVDGVNWVQKVLFITIPQLKHLILFYLVYEVIIVFSWSFNYVYVLTMGGPGFRTTILELLIYDFALPKRLPQMAAALSLMLFVFVLGFIYAQFRLRRAQLEAE